MTDKVRVGKTSVKRCDDEEEWGAQEEEDGKEGESADSETNESKAAEVMFNGGWAGVESWKYSSDDAEDKSESLSVPRNVDEDDKEAEVGAISGRVDSISPWSSSAKVPSKPLSTPPLIVFSFPFSFCAGGNFSNISLFWSCLSPFLLLLIWLDNPLFFDVVFRCIATFSPSSSSSISHAAVVVVIGATVSATAFGLSGGRK